MGRGQVAKRWGFPDLLPVAALRLDQAKRLRHWSRKTPGEMRAEQALDNAILKEAFPGKLLSPPARRRAMCGRS